MSKSEHMLSQGHVENSEPRKSRKSRKFFPEIFKSEFSILAVGKKRKFGNKDTRNNISEISEISEVSEFSIFHFFIFFLIFFSFFTNVFSVFLFYICNYSSTLYLTNIVRLSHQRNMISCVYVLIYKIHSQQRV